jgi:hypothetical protein
MAGTDDARTRIKVLDEAKAALRAGGGASA